MGIDLERQVRVQLGSREKTTEVGTQEVSELPSLSARARPLLRGGPEPLSRSSGARCRVPDPALLA